MQMKTKIKLSYQKIEIKDPLFDLLNRQRRYIGESSIRKNPSL